MDCITYSLEWLENLSLSGSVEPSTVKDYRCNLVAWSPWLSMELSEVTRRDVERGIRGMLAQGRVPSTVKKRMVTMSRVFDDAVDYGDAKANPFDRVRPPKAVRKPKNHLPAGERARLKLRIESSNTQIVVAAALALYAGLREAEICALRASDIDLEAKIGWVRRSVGRKEGGTYLKSSKTGRERDFPIPDPLALVLGRWIDSNCIKNGSFLLTGTEKWADPVVIGRKWSNLCELEGFLGSNGTPPTFHDLRHTFATVAIAAGVDVKTVSSILGHASAAMTLDVYAVADPVAKRASAGMISAAM